MKVNVVVMNHVSFGVNCLVVVEIEKYYLSVFVFYLLEVWKMLELGQLVCYGAWD